MVRYHTVLQVANIVDDELGLIITRRITLTHPTFRERVRASSKASAIISTHQRAIRENKQPTSVAHDVVARRVSSQV